jgi:hypothetical protein
MAIVHESLTRAIGTFNNDFRIHTDARGVLIIANITAKGAGAATLALNLQTYDEASKTYVALTDFVTAAPTAIAIAATAVTPTEQFQLAVYPSFGVVVPTAGKKRAFSAPCPTSLRLVEVIATDTITFSVSAKALQ